MRINTISNYKKLFNTHVVDKSKAVCLKSTVDKRLFIDRKCVSSAILGME